MPLAHSAVGIAAYCALQKGQPVSPVKPKLGLLIACLFLALLPDIDLLFGAVMGDPNRYHFGLSHSLPIALVAGVAVGSLIARTSQAFAAWKVLVCCVLVALSHPVMDFFAEDNSAPFGVPLLWPFSELRFSSPVALFGDVVREGQTIPAYVLSLFNRNNAWSLCVEVLFGAILLLPLILRRVRQRLVPAGLAGVLLGMSLLLYYGIQIEPRWIQVTGQTLPHAGVTRPFTIAHLSDLHLSRITLRERQLAERLESAAPQLTVLTGDVFDPIGESHKTQLGEELGTLVEFIAGLPGEKFLVWGEGILNNRHLLGRALQKAGVRILEDESILSDGVPGVSVTGKLPELALFAVQGEASSCLAGGPTSLNSFLHYRSGDAYLWRDYEFTGDFRHEDGGLGLTFYSQYSRTCDRFYRLRLNDASRMTIAPHGTGPVTGVTTTRSVFRPDRWYRFRIQCLTNPDHTRIQARFWPRESGEPNDWEIVCRDDSDLRLGRGTVGVWVNGAAEAKNFDNLRVARHNRGEGLMAEGFDGAQVDPATWFTERRFETTVRPLHPSAFDLLIVHSPEIVQSYDISGFDLMLAGDTHGGQICWPTGAPVRVNRELPEGWSSGTHAHGSMMVSVSRGVGTSKLPIRLFCRPEVSLITITPAESHESR